MILLAIDSAGESCSAALWDQAKPIPEGLLAWRALTPARAQSELLVELVETVLAEAGLGYQSLGIVAVCHGPGSFTGLRSAVAAARGLALAANLSVIAVSSLEALANGVGHAHASEVLATIDARRGEVYAQRFGLDLQPLPGSHGEPRALSPSDAAAWMAALAPSGAGPLRLVGSGARLVQAHLPAGVATVIDPVQLDARLVALRAVRRLAAGERPVTGFAVRPLYLRAPDARPPVPVVARYNTNTAAVS